MKLMVLDGNSIVNRAYYGVGKARLLTTRQGLHTNAIYGFVTMLQKLLDQEKPDAVCAAFDRREANIPAQGRRGLQGQPQGYARGAGRTDAAAEAGARRHVRPLL